jgi:hypothetical chaperone protein
MKICSFGARPSGLTLSLDGRASYPPDSGVKSCNHRRLGPSAIVTASRTSVGPTIGIDFGTTNTVIAVADPDGRIEALKFNCGEEVFRLYMSALCFWEERRDGALHTRVEGGPWAIEQFLEGTSTHRFIQSFKTFAASRSFKETRIFRQRFEFEDLLAAFFRTLWRNASSSPVDTAQRIVVGRPVRFAGGNPDDSLAGSRYRAAFDRLGLRDEQYVYEPVGAAFFFAQKLRDDAVVLVADFGGGTSDFSVVRFANVGGQLSPRPLGHAGIGVAGDTFDYRIIDEVVSPQLGKGGQYESFGKILPMPKSYFTNFARWNQLAMMKTSGELKELSNLARLALDPGPLHKFIEIVENDMGFFLYRAVSRAKEELSTLDRTEFRFQHADINIQRSITRTEFEAWIREDVDRIAGTVDEALRNAGVTAAEIDKVFLTGGSSFIPAIQRIFADRFGAERIVSGDQFESIAYGLALIGQSENLGDWIVRPS